MKPPKMQPTFRLELPGNADQALAQLRRAIQSPELEGQAESAGPCLDFKIEAADRRFWSPHLCISLSDSEGTEETTEVHGRFSPRPEIWTLIMATYFGTITFAFFAAIYGYVQWSLGQTPWALGVVPVGVALIAALHLASLVGQRLSSDQMELLRSRFDRSVEIAFDKESLTANTR